MVGLLALALVLIASAVRPVHAQQTVDAPSFEELAVRIASLTREARYADAMKAVDQLAEAARRAQGEDNAVFASALAWKATLYQMQGQLTDAQPFFERSLALFRKVLPAGHPHIATSLNNLGFQNQLLGRYDEAERLYKQALEMREKAPWPDQGQIAESLNNVAQIYKRQWRVAEAIPLLRRVLEMREKGLGTEHTAVAQSLQNLAAALELQIKFAEAEPLLRRALDIRRRLQSASHPDVASAVGKLAQNLYKQGKYQEAEGLFRQALAIRRKTQRPGHVDIAESLANLANNHLALNRFEEALAGFKQALAICEAGLPANHPTIARMHMGVAEAAARLGRPGEALAAIRRGTRIRLARPTNDEMARLHFQKHVRFAWMVAAATGGTQSRALFDEALEMGQRATQTDTAIAVQNMAARFAAKDSQLQALVRQREDLEQEIGRLEQRLSAILALPVDKRGADGVEVNRRIEASNKRLVAVDADLRKRFPEYFNLVRPQPLDAKRVASLLGGDEALVVLITAYDNTYVWVVTREGARWHKVDLTIQQLTDAVAALRARLDVETLRQTIGRDTKLFDLALSHHLYKHLLGPAEDLLRGKTHLIEVPYGVLTSLPLQVLITDGPVVVHPGLKDLAMFRDAHWLIRRHAVSVIPSVSSLEGLRVHAKRHGERQRPLVGFGNPRFTVAPVAARGDKRGRSRSTIQVASAARTRGFSSYWRGAEVNLKALRDLPELPETEEELKTVARSLGAPLRDLRFSTAATETAVKQMDLSVYRIVYFATHGLVAGEVQGLGEPALVLTPPDHPTAIDDGLLTASEVAQLRLNADWVVLAACNTAAGDTPGADALSGLARAFFQAGARALLVSHWRVGSEAAAKLTTSTFDQQRRARDIGRAEALRRAMLAYMADKNDPWSGHPGFWAPFSVVGEGLN